MLRLYCRLILFGLLLCGPANADGLIIDAGVAAFCDCSGDVAWCLEVSADDATPAEIDITAIGGCADGGYDTTGTANSSVDIDTAPTGKTGYSIYSPGASDYYIFDWPAGLDAAGTLVFDIYITTWVSTTQLITFLGSAGADQLIISIVDGDDLLLTYIGQSTSKYAQTTAAGLLVDNWYTVTAKWRQGAADPSLYIEANSVSDDNTDDLTAWGNASSLGRIGIVSADASVVDIKNIRYYPSWQ